MLGAPQRLGFVLIFQFFTWGITVKQYQAVQNMYEKCHEMNELIQLNRRLRDEAQLRSEVG